MEKLIASKNRRQDRLNYVKYWAGYVRTHPDKDWSRQQNVLINSIMQNAKNSKLTKAQYLRIKGETKNKKPKPFYNPQFSALKC